jgi:hypothetical protein
MDDAEDEDFKSFVGWQMFALRGALTPIVGNGVFLKAYLEAQQDHDVPLKVNFPIVSSSMEITPQMALRMFETILVCAQRIDEIQETLRQRASGASRE